MIRGIMLLSTPGKVLNRILLERMKEAVDPKLRDQQAGFRRNRSCADQIASLRIIVEQSLEWNSPLYINFIDYEKAFDSVDRETMWKLLRHYGVPKKIISLIQCTFQDMSCKTAHTGQLSESFEVKIGVRQGCLLSPFLFLLVIDWIMKTTTTGRSKRYTVDTLDTARRPRLRWWPGAPVTQSQPDAGQDHSPGDHISRDRAQDQQKEDWADEDEHNCQRTNHSWWRAHKGGGVFHLPGKCGWPSERHRPRRHSQNRQGKNSFCHAQKHLGIWRNQHENQTPHLQLQCKVSPALRMWDMADNKDDATKDPDILQHMSEAHLQNPMAREYPKWRSVEASRTRTSGQADTAEEVGLDWTHAQKASIQHHTPSPDLEPAGEEEERPASQQLEARHWSRAETAGDQLVRNDQSSPGQSAMAGGRWWPMFHWEWRA